MTSEEGSMEKKQILLALDEKVMNQLTHWANQKRMTKTAVMREALDLWLTACHKLPPKFSVAYAFDRGLDLINAEEAKHRAIYTPPDAVGMFPLQEDVLPDHMPDWARQHTLQQREEQKLKPIAGKKKK